MTQQSHTNLSDRYYHWLAAIYARLIDDQQRAMNRQSDQILDEAHQSDQIIDEASTAHLHPAGIYQPDMVDSLRLRIAAAQQTLRRDQTEFAEEWRHIEADLAVKLLAIADPTEVQLNALAQQSQAKKS